MLIEASLWKVTLTRPKKTQYLSFLCASSVSSASTAFILMSNASSLSCRPHYHNRFHISQNCPPPPHYQHHHHPPALACSSQADPPPPNPSSLRTSHSSWPTSDRKTRCLIHESKPHHGRAARKSQSHPDKKDGLSFSGPANPQVGTVGGASTPLWVP